MRQGLLTSAAVVLPIVAIASTRPAVQILAGIAAGLLAGLAVTRQPRRCAECGQAGWTRLSRAAYRRGAVPDLVRVDGDRRWYCRDPLACAERVEGIR